MAPTGNRVGTRRFVVDVPQQLAERIDRAALKAGMTRAEVLREAARDLVPRLERALFADPNPKRSKRGRGDRHVVAVLDYDPGEEE